MDYGPFISATFVAPTPANNVTHRGIAVHFEARLPGDQIGEAKERRRVVKIDPGQCGLLFDTELLRYSAGWSGGFIRYSGVVFDGGHGANPAPRGTIAFGTTASPGWGHDGNLKDPRPIPHGPLPRHWAHYKGLYRTDKGVVFSYTVGASTVLDMPNVRAIDNRRVFERSLNITPSKQALIAVLANVEGGKGRSEGSVAVVEKGDTATVVRAINLPPAGVLDVQGNGRILLRLSALNRDARVKLLFWSGPKAEQQAARATLAKINDAPDLTPLTKGGKARSERNAHPAGQAGEGRRGVRGRFHPGAVQEPVQVVDALRRLRLLHRRPGRGLHLERRCLDRLRHRRRPCEGHVEALRRRAVPCAGPEDRGRHRSTSWAAIRSPGCTTSTATARRISTSASTTT